MNGEQDASSSGNGCSWLLIVTGFFALLGAFSDNAFITLVAIIVGLLFIGVGLFAMWGGHLQASGSEEGAQDRDEPPEEATTVRRPRSSSEDFEPWTTPDRMQPIVGEFYQQKSYARLARQLDVPSDGTRATVDLAADLNLDRANPHARHGVAISVRIEGVLAGYLSDDIVPSYLPVLEQLERERKHLTVRARMYLHFDTSKKKWRPSTVLRLPEPDGIFPANPMPDGDLELIPPGRVIQVVGEENHMDYLSEIVDPSGPAHLIATLRPTQMGTRTFYDTVQVLIDGHEVGAFSRAMGEQTVSLVKLIVDAGLIPVARATVEGNSLRAEVKVRMQRAADFDQDRIHELQQIARERRATTNHHGEAFDWDDDALLNGPRERQDREAEDGGA